MFWFGLAVGLGVAVGEFFFLRNNPKYLNVDGLLAKKREKLETLYEELRRKLGKK
jgi:hypothetical protein